MKVLFPSPAAYVGLGSAPTTRTMSHGIVPNSMKLGSDEGAIAIA